MATIRKRGAKWQVQIRRSGLPTQSRSFGSRKDASEWARYWEAQADRGRLPQCTKILDQTTLGALVRRYRDEVVPLKRGCHIETLVLNAFLREPMCKKMLSQISSDDFLAYRDRRLLEISPISLARQLSPIRNMFTVAERDWNIPLQTSPLSAVRLPAQSKKRARRLHSEELDSLVRTGGACRNIYVIPAMILAVETGLRRGELLSVRWEDVDQSNRLLLVPRTKNGHPRVVPLTLRALDELAQLKRCHPKSERVLPISPNSLRLAWDRLIRRAGITDLHFHDLRHEAISRFFELGLTVPEVASISGHRDIRMLLRYAHADRNWIIRKFDRTDITRHAVSTTANR